MAYRKPLATSLGIVWATALGLLTNAAAAEPVPSLDLRGFNPPTDPDSGLYFEPASSPDTFDWNAALWFGYAYSPVTLRDPGADETVFDVVEHQLTGDLVFNIGFAERVALGLDMSFMPFQSGDDPSPEAEATLGAYELPTAAFGDLKLVGKVTLVPPTNQEFGGFALALHERFGFPTGDTESFIGEGHVTSETRLLAEYRYVALTIHGALGAKFRASHEEFGCAGLPPAAPGAEPPECSTTFGHELPWGVALSLQPQALGLDEAGRMVWFVEAFGHVPMYPETPFSNAKVSQAQLGGGARFAIGDVSILAAVDAALIGGIGNPPFRGTVSVQWAPRSHDVDEDGVHDDQDRCPDLEEDIDGFEDDDGCPDWDNDDDGVPDEDDRCQGEQEDEDGTLDDDGCIDPDNDADGIPDVEDTCPDAAGIPSTDPKQRGCPDRDPDKDGVDVDSDRCADDPEDKDGFKDDDGCPDLDNDDDGIADEKDACRDETGVANADPEQHGCPDKDGDGIADKKDACPDKAGQGSDEKDKHGCPAEEDKPARRPGRGGR